MSEQLSDQELKRLSDLAALRDRGVLSDEEFQRAKQRLLQGRPPADDPETAPAKAPRPLFRHWLLLSLAGLAILVLVLWFVVMRPAPESEVQTTSVDDLVNETVAPLPGPELCSSNAIYGQIADAVFDRAVQQFAGDPRPLASLRGAVGVRMQYPVLRDADTAIGRAVCSGHLVIDIPPDARDEFEGAAALQADVDYTIESPGAGAATLAGLNGTEAVVQRLVEAATLLSEGRAAPQEDVPGDLPPGAYAPSIDCSEVSSPAERAICQDEDLARRDRELASRYRRLERILSPAELRRIEEGHRRFVELRSRCPDASCLAEIYARWSAVLDRLVPGGEPAEY